MVEKLRHWKLRLEAWASGADLTLLLGALVVLVAAWAFIEIADEVFEGSTHAFDQRLLKALRQPDNPGIPIGPAWFADGVRDITALGSPLILGIITAIAVGYLLVCRKRHTAGFVLLANVGGAIVLYYLKLWFGRERPDVVPKLTPVDNLSFPSGHAQISAVVFLTLGTILARLVSARRRKLYILATALMLTVLVGSSRVYLGVHYPTDVLAGWMAGIVWALGCWGVARFLQRRKLVESLGSDEPTDIDERPT